MYCKNELQGPLSVEKSKNAKEFVVVIFWSEHFL